MPKRGEVWMVDLGLAQKVRPALIISVPCEEVDRSLVTIVPHTTQLRSSRFEITLDVAFLKQGAFLIQGLVTIPTKVAIRKLGILNEREMSLVENGLKIWLGLK